MASSNPFSYMQLANIELIEQIHAQYLQDPMSVDSSWRYFFEGVAFGGSKLAPEKDLSDIITRAYRHFGHLKAKTNPFEDQEKRPLPLEFKVKGDLIEKLEKLYCGPIGYQYTHCDPEVVAWLQNEIEQKQAPLSLAMRKRIFRYLTQAEWMERYLHVKYVGQKRFSLEGAETVIPMLAEVVESGSQNGLEEMIIGMPHRGRINVLANILRKSYQMIFSEFEDYVDPDGGDGDVKYHKGYSSTYATESGGEMHVSVTANPSHLESVIPVVQGRVYAKQIARGDTEKKRVMGLVLHGDSSLAGQGVVYETMQLSRLKGYGTGGTLHLVVDNQVGFTTGADEYRSTQYSTDIALAFQAPVFHVNAEHPEACIRAVQLAVQLRQLFHCDVFLNLICYRKYGHNETDEPSFTQPKLYDHIRKRPSICQLYQDELIAEGALDKQSVERMEKEFHDHLDQELQTIKQNQKAIPPSAFEGAWSSYRKVSNEALFTPLETGVPEKQLRLVAERFSQIPEGFNVHPKLKRLIQDRLQRIDGEMDWALVEHLSFASLLIEKTPIRLSGQDSARGTFTQRHAIWIDQKTNERYIPLCHISADQGPFQVYNSPLSEFGVLAFEYGYSLAAPEALILWEAQFGDFANGAQVLIDQYLVASEQRWQRASGLVLLLPHGYEGQGAEHSSARLERFLQLCAQNNIQVCYPTTPAQYFHLLRRQVMRPIRLPLIIMTPKGLLRHPLCVSRLVDLTQGHFEEVLIEPHPGATHLICCSGRIYYDLVHEREKRGCRHVAIIRFEQLYPLTEQIIEKAIRNYASIKQLSWVQEEPLNQGAARLMTPLLQGVADRPIRVVARGARGAAASGSHAMHAKEYEALMERVFSDETVD